MFVPILSCSPPLPLKEGIWDRSLYQFFFGALYHFISGGDKLGEEEEKEPEENKDNKPRSQAAKNISICHEAAEYVDAMYEKWAQEETNPVIKFCNKVGLRAIRHDDTYGLELNSGFKGTVQTIEDFPEHLDLAYTQVQRLQNGLSLEPGGWGKIEDYGLGILGAVGSLQSAIAIEGKPGKLKKSTWSRQRNKVSSKARAFPAHSSRPQRVSAEAWLQKTMPSQGIGSANSPANSAPMSRPYPYRDWIWQHQARVEVLW
ncbi:MAG: hypothetical protein K0M45_05740 [Candidatus Paracaedibacteraceae bacterium]|nr:hypothetical protein [Candidatus Paracaedibacteraceae bacterium]